MGHFINNAQGGKTAEWMMQSWWKLCQLQLTTWGSSTCVHCFPSVHRFELTSIRHGVYRRLRYCDGWRSKIVHRPKRYVAKTKQKFTVLCMKFVVNRQWTIVQFPVGLLVFI